MSDKPSAKRYLADGGCGPSRRAPEMIAKKFSRVTRSPLNPVRWALDLECGHEVWVTSQRKPARKIAPCEACTRAAETSSSGGAPSPRGDR